MPAAAAAVLDLNGNDTTINGLSQSASSSANMVVNNGSGLNTLSVGNNNVNSTFAGVLADNNTGFGGTLALAKIGTGTLTLAGSNAYSGPTTIRGGTLALAAGSSLTVGQGASSLFAPAIAGPAAGVVSVPEPGTLALLAVALWSAIACRRLKRQSVSRRSRK
jgi:autotransporter-associated beta strand protein